MPLPVPVLDDRTYEDLLDEALARIPVHTPEWTNFNQSDPGVTLIEVFAFLTENLLYRSNQIPERNRRKFLNLLGVPLRPAASARGIVTVTNERGLPETVTLRRGVELRAGQVPFYIEHGLDVLPIETQAFFKKPVDKEREAQLLPYYQTLHAAQGRGGEAPAIALYETVPFPTGDLAALDLGRDTVDHSLWIALMVRAQDRSGKAAVRAEIAGKTITLGIVPEIANATRTLAPVPPPQPDGKPPLEYEIPFAEKLSGTGERDARYRPLEAAGAEDVLVRPGIVHLTLPSSTEDLTLWDLEPLEAGTRNFPPALQDTNLEARVITWLRVRASATAPGARLLWAGINAATVVQRARIVGEPLPDGTGQPDQVVVLSKTPVVPRSVALRVTQRVGEKNEQTDTWTEIDDLASGGGEVPAYDPRLPLGTPEQRDARVKVFALDPESGTLRFGDGIHGARPPFGARLRADYEYGVGRDGNVNAGAIKSGPDLPVGLKVTNPIPTWGGAEAETVNEGEKQISRYLQHRDRLVNKEDFATITRRTPGVDIGRVEVIPAFNPELPTNEPGDAPGAVTLLVIPKYDSAHPDAPEPDRLFLDTICDYVDARRLVTTEVFLSGPDYREVWVSVGIGVKAGYAPAEVREEVKRALMHFLSPLPQTASGAVDHAGSPFADAHDGWPLRKPVMARELMAVASRVKGVVLVNTLLVAEETEGEKETVGIRGLELPRLRGIAVQVGEAASLDDLRGQGRVADARPDLAPVPIVPEEC